MPACTIPVNVYQYVHELLRTRALWQNNCQISLRLLKSSKNPQLHRQQLLPANLIMCLRQIIKIMILKKNIFYKIIIVAESEQRRPANYRLHLRKGWTATLDACDQSWVGQSLFVSKGNKAAKSELVKPTPVAS